MSNLVRAYTYYSDPEESENTEVAADNLSFWSQAVADWVPNPPGPSYTKYHRAFNTYLDRQDIWFSSANIGSALNAPLDVFRVPHFSSINKPDPRSNTVIQEWEGFVTKVGDTDFTARLVDLTDPSDDLEEADFPIDELSRDDRKLLREGAIFRWLIGYQDTIAGNRTRFSKIVFRRLPAWTSKDIREARREAASLPGPEVIDYKSQTNE